MSDQTRQLKFGKKLFKFSQIKIEFKEKKRFYRDLNSGRRIQSP
jgi:hypothetical protein